MKRTHFASLTLIGLSLSLALVACKTGDGDGNADDVAAPVAEEELPEAAAGALCDLIFGCSCEDPGHADQASCVDTEGGDISEDQAAAQAAGLTYDAQCAGDLIAQSEAAGCAVEIEFNCDSFCSAYHGELELDATCSVPVAGQASWSDCAQGLWCINGACQDPCGGGESDLLGPGDMCRDADGQSLGECALEPGLWCDFESSTCVVLPGVGEPCYGGEICGVGAVCDWSGDAAECVAIPGAGEACSFWCDEGLYCDGVDGVEGTCLTLPGEGEPCGPQGACSEGNYCAEDGSQCVALPAWVCG